MKLPVSREKDIRPSPSWFSPSSSHQGWRRPGCPQAPACRVSCSAARHSRPRGRAHSHFTDEQTEARRRFSPGLADSGGHGLGPDSVPSLTSLVRSPGLLPKGGVPFAESLAAGAGRPRASALRAGDRGGSVPFSRAPGAWVQPPQLGKGRGDSIRLVGRRSGRLT